MKRITVIAFFIYFLAGCSGNASELTDVIVLGDGTGATTAAIASARGGANTVLITSMPWLGGMLSSAGVSAIDGNHNLPAGLWGQFRENLRRRYETNDLMTGWVSNTQFEPKVADEVLKEMAGKYENLHIIYEAEDIQISKHSKHWVTSYSRLGTKQEIHAKIAIDGSDLGDFAAMVDIPYRLGMDAQADTQEEEANAEPTNLIQDLTYVAILKKRKEKAKPMEKPQGYDKSKFLCACQKLCESDKETHPCTTMLNYAKLPDNKYMINWPIEGNDVYLNLVELSSADRDKEINLAKQKTMQFLYFIQQELGFDSLELHNEFGTNDGLAMMPYHREGRRIKGKAFLTLNEIKNPYDYQMYQQGIAVGDYPVDHHHKEKDKEFFDFPSIPSYSVPLGSLIPQKIDNFIVADKAISVSNLANGTTRLQPVIMQIGEAAGILAALAIKQNLNTSQIPIRNVQEEILQHGGYLLPTYDVEPTSIYFESLQKIAACGILRGEGKPYKWANQTWFYPDSLITNGSEIISRIGNYLGKPTTKKAYSSLSIRDLSMEFRIEESAINNVRLGTEISKDQPLTRGQLAAIIDQTLRPFKSKQVLY